MKQKLFVLIINIVILTSCSYIEKQIEQYENDDIVAIVEDKYLYKDDINNLVPQGTNSTDSAAIIESYIQRWATNALMLKNAERNVSNQVEINKMVEDYRQRLIIHNYQQEMVNQKIDIPTDEEALEFYNTHKESFILEDVIVKGASITLPNNIKTDKIQNKFKKLNDNLEDIEKYALQYATDYVLFIENWMPINNVIDEKTINITKIGQYEHKDSLHTTFISITDYMNIGEIAPFEFIKEDVKHVLYDQQKMDYLNNFGKELYNYGIKHGQIKIKNQE